ncbi:MAG TPA: hypothetical protein VF168_10775 [Trueperaceae bacterium]
MSEYGVDFGRRFVVDASRPGSWTPIGRSDVEAYLAELNELLEGPRKPALSLVVEEADGFSACVLGHEAHVVLHLFPALGVLSLQVFSRRDVLLSDLTRNLGQRFGVGRFESHLGHATKSLPKDEERLARVLRGDRSYARVRLRDSTLTI